MKKKGTVVAVNAPEDAARMGDRALEELFTVGPLSIVGRLVLTLTKTNFIESTISVAATTMGRVHRWRDGSMEERSVAAGMLYFERSFTD